MSVTVREVIDEVLFKLNQNVHQPIALTRPKVLTEVNNCLIDLAEDAKLFVEKYTLQLESGVAVYDLPENFYQMVDVKDSTRKEIYPTTLDALRSYSDDWENEEGEPRWYLLNFDGANVLRFFLTPGDDYDELNTYLTYLKYATAVTLESEELPYPVHNSKKLFVDYCLGQLYSFQMEVQNNSLGAMYISMYQAGKQKWKTRSMSPPKLTIIGVNGKQQAIAPGPKLPDNYPPLWR